MFKGSTAIWTAAIVYLLSAGVARADGAFVGFGLGAFNSAKGGPAEVKYGQVGFRESVLYGLADWQYKVGFWGDGSGDPTRKGSFIVSTGPGWNVVFDPIEIRVGTGLAVISTPDSYLGGRFPQFDSELYLGVRDSAGRAVGFKYEHVSSAGLVSPNKGRDFLLLEIGLGW